MRDDPGEPRVVITSPDDGMLFGLKKEGRPDTCHNMDELEAIMLHEINQSQKDKYRRSPRT